MPWVVIGVFQFDRTKRLGESAHVVFHQRDFARAGVGEIDLAIIIFEQRCVDSVAKFLAFRIDVDIWAFRFSCRAFEQ